MLVRWSFREKRGSSEGFTLIEVVVAMVIILIVMTAMASVFVKTLSTLSLARQRQQGTALATRSMEELRAVPYANLTAGLLAGDLAGDANVVSVAGVSRLRLAASGVDEPLVVSSTPTPAPPPPLNPHVVTKAVDGVTYTVSTYVTQLAVSGPYTLTSVVRWSSNVTGGPRTILQRSVAFSPSGCLSTLTHPFSGPCQSAFSGQSGTTPATISVVNDVDTSQPLVGFTGTSVGLALPLLSSSLAVEQTASATTRVTTTAAAATTNGTRSGSGGRNASALGSTDPSTGVPVTSLATIPAQTSTGVAISGPAGTVTATPTSADVGSGSAAADGAASCTNPGAGALPTGGPCAEGTVRATGADAVVSADLTGTAPVRALGPFDLARMGAAPVAGARAVATRIRTSGTGGCPTTSGDGCAYAMASRSLGTLALGGLPPAAGGDSRPAGFTSAVTVTGLVETARAESGAGERSPAVTRTGTVSYWNGTGITNVDLSSVASPSSIDPPAAMATYAGVGGTVSVSADAVITIGSVTAATTGAWPCVSSQCSQSSRGSTISVTVVYVITAAGSETTRFAVTANLGTTLAQATYRGAPNA